ncbi:MAG: hypothetical protein O3A25_19705 [Acidobacteria bacterium]|nr:hypothetical protein [Acidobacteriota bacterium]
MNPTRCTPFDLPADLPIYVDTRLIELEFLILGSGSRASKIKVAPEVLTKLPGAVVVEIANA